MSLSRRLTLSLLAILVIFLLAVSALAQDQPKKDRAKEQDGTFAKSGQYKKFTRALISMIATGDTEQAISEYEKRLPRLPDDLECLFGLAFQTSDLQMDCTRQWILIN